VLDSTPLLYIFAYEFHIFWSNVSLRVEQNSDGAFPEVIWGFHDDVYTLLQFLRKFTKDFTPFLQTPNLLPSFLSDVTILGNYLLSFLSLGKLSLE